MSLEAGEIVYGGDLIETRGGSSTAGEAVAIDGSGDMATVDTDANDLAGVVSESGNLVLKGAVVAAVADGVVDGNALAGGNATDTTTGSLDADSSGNALALSDKGGTWQGKDVPAGYAVVLL